MNFVTGDQSKAALIQNRLKKIFSLLGLTRGRQDMATREQARFIAKELKMFRPTGNGPLLMMQELTIKSINQTFPFIQHLLEVLGTTRQAKEVSAEDFCSSEADKDKARRLGELFDRYNSDKAIHQYHYIYAPILDNEKEATALFEFGLGTNNLKVASNMGAGGQPGASLRAFRDFLPNARIYGADIDREILFHENRIETYYVDQTDLTSYSALGPVNNEVFDLIIDDGLHSPNANIAVLAFAIGKIRVNGWIIIEDIRSEAIPIWHTVAALLPDEFECYLFSTKAGPVFGVKRLA